VPVSSSSLTSSYFLRSFSSSSICLLTIFECSSASFWAAFADSSIAFVLPFLAWMVFFICSRLASSTVSTLFPTRTTPERMSCACSLALFDSLVAAATSFAPVIQSHSLPASVSVERDALSISFPNSSTSSFSSVNTDFNFANASNSATIVSMANMDTVVFRFAYLASSCSIRSPASFTSPDIWP